MYIGFAMGKTASFACLLSAPEGTGQRVHGAPFSHSPRRWRTGIGEAAANERQTGRFSEHGAVD